MFWPMMPPTYLVATWLLYVDDAGRLLLLQVVDEAGPEVVTLRHHLHLVTSARHCQQHAVLGLRLSIQQQQACYIILRSSLPAYTDHCFNWMG